MAAGSVHATCAAETDFAGLVCLIDFCRGLQRDGDAKVWQPEQGNNVLSNVLQPARTARNRFAHNSGMSFQRETDVSECVKALIKLVEHLPLAAARQTAVLGELRQLLQVGMLPSTSDPAELRHAFDTLHAALRTKLGPVVTLAQRMAERDAAELQATMDEGMFSEVTARVPRAQHALPWRGSGEGAAGAGAGAGAGSGAGDGAVVQGEEDDAAREALNAQEQQRRLQNVTTVVDRAKVWQALQR